MDKLITVNFAGKAPFVQEDLAWLDQCYRDAINDLFNDFPGLLEANCIMSGCAYSEAGGVVSVQSGWVLIAGEMMYFEGDSITGTAANCKITYEDSYDAAGAKVFANGTSHNVYFKRRGKLVTSTGQSYARVIGERLKDRIFDKMSYSWQSVSSVNPGWSTSNLKYRKVPGGVMITGTVASDDDLDDTIFTLPAGYRPTQEVKQIIPTSHATYPTAVLTVTTGGEVNMNQNYTANYYINILIPQ